LETVAVQEAALAALWPLEQTWLVEGRLLELVLAALLLPKARSQLQPMEY
jgi:hypothetical protein